MKILIGLGNPDSKYIYTRHNLGQLVITKLAADLKVKLEKHPKTNSQLAKYHHSYFGITNEYMNNSGLSISKILNFFKIESPDLYLIHDDLDLPIGEWKLQFDRGPAGHNGVISTIGNLGTQAFWRLRIGIGHPIAIPVESYVLQPFTSDEQVIINQTIDKIVIELAKLLD